LTDRQTDRQTDGQKSHRKTAVHFMQRGKKCKIRGQRGRGLGYVTYI